VAAPSLDFQADPDTQGAPIPLDFQGDPASTPTQVPTALAASPITGALSGLSAIGDAALHYVRTYLATPAAGLTELGTAAATGGDWDAARAVGEQVQNEITGKPYTAGGNALVANIKTATDPVVQKAQKTFTDIADSDYEKGVPVAPGVNIGAGSPAAGAYGAAVPQLLAYLLGGGVGRNALSDFEVPQSTIPPLEPGELPGAASTDGAQRMLAAPGATPEPATPAPPKPLPPTKVTQDGPQTTVQSQNGVLTAQQQNSGNLRVTNSQTAPAAQGQGEGTARLAAAADTAHSKGSYLESDVSVSPNEAAGYMKLAAQGYAVHQNSGSQVNPTTGDLISDDPRRPVFVVGPKDNGGASPMPTVNIGLNTNDGKGITPAQAISKLQGTGATVLDSAVHTSNTEPTLVAQLSRPLNPDEANGVATGLNQDAIVQTHAGAGQLYGPKAADWGPYNPNYFLTLDGRTASQASAPPPGGPGAPAGGPAPAGGTPAQPQAQSRSIFGQPAREGLSQAEPTAEGQQNRVDTFKRIGLDEVRNSAITGDSRQAGTEFQTSKLKDNPAGDRLAGVVDAEQHAVETHADSLIDTAGGSRGLAQPDLTSRGRALTAPVNGLNQSIENATQAAYEAAKQKATGPIQLPSVQALTGAPAQFLGTVEGKQLLEGVNARMKELGLTGPNETFNPATVEQAERFRQYLNDNWTPRTSRLIGQLKDALDKDVTKAAGADVFAAARALRAQRAKLIEEPDIASKLLTPRDANRLGVNRSVDEEDVPKYLTGQSALQVGHYVNLLRAAAKVPELAPQALTAMRELRAQFANEYHAAGASTAGKWNQKAANRYLKDHEQAMGTVFEPGEMQQFKDNDDAARWLHMDRSYPGAMVQGHNIGVSGALGVVEHGATVAGAVMGHIPGAIVGHLASKGAKNISDAASKAAAEKLITNLDEWEPPQGATLGQKSPGSRQRGGPAFDPYNSQPAKKPAPQGPGDPYNTAKPGKDVWGAERQKADRSPARLADVFSRQRGGPKYTPPGAAPTLAFRHFSNLDKPSVKLDPNKMGSGIPAAEWKRVANNGAPKVTSAYGEDHPDSEVEHELRGRNEYRIEVPTSKMYDLSTDARGFRKQGAIQAQKNGTDAHSETEKLVKGAGYTGYHIPNGAGIFKGQARFFRPVEATRAVPKEITSNLTSPEQRQLERSNVASAVTDAFKNLPHSDELSAMALEGVAKRGWYADAAKALSSAFGPDAPRFAALLASQSPRLPVERNLTNAVKIWDEWDKAGRPTSRGGIVAAVKAGAGPEGLLPARLDNTIASLTHPDPEKMTLSGPKVHSFMRNLMGDVHSVTLDGWMAAGAGIDPAKLGGGKTEGGPGKSSTYLAYSAKVRQAAAKLSALTGEKWTPAEVQETAWSWMKTAYEHADKFGRMASIPELARNGEINDELIKGTPDFHTLLTRSGRVTGVPGTQGSDASLAAGSGEARASHREALAGSLASAAERLEALRRSRMSPAKPGDEQTEIPF
jgi:hypothetical protein